MQKSGYICINIVGILVVTQILLHFSSQISTYVIKDNTVTIDESVNTDLRLIQPELNENSYSITIYNNQSISNQLYLLIPNTNANITISNLEQITFSYQNNYIYRLRSTTTININQSDTIFQTIPSIYIGKYEIIQLCSNLLLIQRMITFGICIFSIFYLLSLYSHKKSEKYILIVCIIAYITGMRSFKNSFPIIFNKEIIDLLNFDIFELFFGHNIIVINIQRICNSLINAILHIYLINRFFNVVSKEKERKLCIFTMIAFLICLSTIWNGYYFEIIKYTYELLIYSVELVLISSACYNRKNKFNIFSLLWICSVAIGITDSIMKFSLVPNYFVNKIVNLKSFQSLFYLGGFVYCTNIKFSTKFRESEIFKIKLEEVNLSLNKKVEEKTFELQQSYNLLKENQKQKNDLLASLAHNLKTPLFSIIGYTEILREKIEINISESKTYIEILYRNELTIKNIIQNLFTMTRLENGYLKMNYEYFNMYMLCDQILNVSRPLAIQKESDLIVKCKHNLYYKGDFLYLVQAFQNIIDNALRHTDRHGIIKMTVIEYLDSIIITISDNGEGIEEKNLEKIFKANYSKHKDNRSSSGIGLTITQQIIRLHQGTIKVNSQINEGTKFIIRLPIDEMI